jgi:hypothetical protein
MSRDSAWGLAVVTVLGWFVPARIQATEYFMIIAQTKGDVDDNGAAVWRPGPSFDSSLDIKGMKPTREVVKEVRQQMDASGDYVAVEILSDSRPIEWKGGPPPASLLRQDARLRNGYDPNKQPTLEQLQQATDKLLKEQAERAKLLNESLALEDKKARLDRMKERLDRERDDLLADRRALRAAEKELNALKKRSGGEKGPYQAVKAGYEDVVGGRKTFASYAEAAAWADGGTVTDKDGKPVTSAPKADAAAAKAVRDKEEALRKRRAESQDRLAAYVANRQTYQQALDQYEKQNGKYGSGVEELKKQTYNPPE